MLVFWFILMCIASTAPDDLKNSLKDTKLRVIFPVPLDMPNRNDRANQCWLRVEEADIIETLVVHCSYAHEFLKGYLNDYNSKKMAEDGVELLTWTDIPKSKLDEIPPTTYLGLKTVKDWRVTTYKDPITHAKVYVTTKADCRLIMYSREGMTNYRIDCDKLLYFLNTRNGIALSRVDVLFICLLNISVLLLR